MKKLKVIVIFLILGLVYYFYWHNKLGSKKLSSIPSPPKNIEVNKPSEQKNTQKIELGPEKLSAVKKNREIYIANLNRIIKAQYKEIEDCEKEFNIHFGDLLKMSKEKQLEYLKDQNNLEDLLEKFSSINFTTPSSAKVLREFANPLSEQVKISEVYHKPGLQDRVEICSPRGKRDILELLYKSNIMKKAIMRALLGYFENEISTLDLPYILFDQIIELKKSLKFYGVPETKFPKLGKIEKNFKVFDKKINDLINSYRPNEAATWDYKEAEMQYDFALSLQPEIQSLLNNIRDELF